MPFDPTPAPPTDRATIANRALARWLLLVAAMVWAMVALGGATRLSGSGLSIMEWAPIMGALPPLSDAEWQRLYDLYRTIPQYRLVNRGFGMDGFKAIFWLEYLHRLWGRLIGLAFALPLLWFWWRGRIPAGFAPRLLLLLGLGAMQGAIGWYMVASGFQADRTVVSPYRLVLHLGLALLIFALLVDTALRLLPRHAAAAPSGARFWARATFGAALLAMLAGGFTAGIRAGFDYNTFPLMQGQLVPPGYLGLDPWWRSLTADIATVQFHHRLAATATLLLAAVTLWRAWQHRTARLAVLLLAGTIAAQYALGIATLLHVVPQGLGTLHQALAVGVLGAGVLTLHRLRPA
jgi:cytochrome c oxidase assembly protein subunit 15